MNSENKTLLVRRLQAFLIQEEDPITGKLKNDVTFEVTLVRRFQVLSFISQVIIFAKIVLERKRQPKSTEDSSSDELVADLTEEGMNIPLVIVELDETKTNLAVKSFRMFPYTDDKFLGRLRKCIEHGEVKVS